MGGGTSQARPPKVRPLRLTPEAELDLDDDRLHPTPSGGLSARRFHNASRPTSALPVRHLLRNRQAGDRRLRCVPWRSRPGTLATTPTRRIKQAVGADRLRRPLNAFPLCGICESAQHRESRDKTTRRRFMLLDPIRCRPWGVLSSVSLVTLTVGAAIAQPPSPVQASAAASRALRLTGEPVAFHTRDVDYLQVDGETFQATIYQPEGPGPFPALLDVHGGAWVR